MESRVQRVTDGQFCCLSSVIELAEVQNAGRGQGQGRKVARLRQRPPGRGGDIGKSPDSDAVIEKC